MKYLIIFMFIFLYGFEGVELYKKGEYKKAEKYFREINSTIAKAFLAKIYYKEGEYNKSKKLIKEILSTPKIPKKVKKELNQYLLVMKGVKWFNINVSIGMLYDSNLNYSKKDSSKKSDAANIEDIKIKGYYLKNNIDLGIDLKLQNRLYITHPKNNYFYIESNAFLTYYSFINSRIKVGYERKSKSENYLYKSELYLFKDIGNYQLGVVGIGNYYTNENFNSKDLGGGVRGGFLVKSFKGTVSFISYFSDTNDKLDNRNYKAEFKGNWQFSDIYLSGDYFYNVSLFDKYKINIHYFNVEITTKESKHIYYSSGITNYYSLSRDKNKELRKYEVYIKFSYYF